MQVTDKEITKADANSGVDIRNAINAIFKAINTQNSGNSEPLNPEPFMPWVDTSNSTTHYLKCRNHANDGWFVMFEYNVTTKQLKVGDWYTKAEVSTLLNQLKSEIVNGSPALLDTLSELSAALGNDANFSTTILNALSGKLGLNGGIMTGAITALRETKVAMSANDIDLATGNLFTKTITAATTFTISNALSSGNANSFMLELTNGGAYTITWFSGVKWANGIAPTLTASGVDILGFYSHDGGTTWRGLVLAKDSK